MILANMDQIWLNAKKLIANDRVEECLDLLQQAGSGSLAKDIVILQARLSQLRTESITGADTSAKRLRICESILLLIETQENHPIQPTPPNAVQNQRVSRLKTKVLECYALLDEWESKLEIAENPGERKRCELEIARLQNIVRQYLSEIGDA